MRSTVKQWITGNLGPRIEQLSTTEHPAQFSYGWPGRDLMLNGGWISQTTGTVTFPFIMAGRKSRDDEFTMTVTFQASGPADSRNEADDRVESYAAAFEDLIAEDPSLGDMDYLMHAIFEQDAIRGPDPYFLDTGVMSLMEVDLKLHTRT